MMKKRGLADLSGSRNEKHGELAVGLDHEFFHGPINVHIRHPLYRP